MILNHQDTEKSIIFRCYEFIKKPGRQICFAFSVGFVIAILLSGPQTFSQDRVIAKNVSKMEREALTLFNQGDFVNALPLYSQLLSLDPKNPDLNYRFGVCLLQGDRRDLERPLKYLEKAVKAPGIEPEAVFYLGLAYHYNYRFSDAITQFERYKTKADPKKIKELGVDRQIEMCKNGFMLLSNVSDIYVLAKSEVNLLDFYRAYHLKDFGGEFLYKPDIFKSKIDRKRNDKNVVFFPKVLDEVFFSSYGDDFKNGLDIYHAFREPNGSWGKPIRLKGAVNTVYDEDYPYLLPDGKTLYFCSKGHNSMGGYDIFRSRLDTITQQWGEPENLDFAINTPFDDLLFVTDKSKHFAFFASNRSSAGDQVMVYKVRIDKRPEKKQDITLQPLLAGQEGNNAGYEHSLSIIKEMSKLDVNMNADSQADTAEGIVAVEQNLVKTEKKPEPVIPGESLQQKLEQKILQKKQSQARVDTAFAIVGSLERSLKAIEKVREKVQISAESVVNPRDMSLAKAVVKDLERNEKVRRARLENARYRAGTMQQLVSTQKVDSANKAYLTFKKDIKASDTLTDFSDKLMSDLKTVIASPKNIKDAGTDFFTGEEFRKIRKDSSFLLGFVEQSISAKISVTSIEKNKVPEKENHAVVDSTFAIVNSLERSIKAFEATKANVSAEAARVVTPGKIPLAKAVVRELERNEKVMQARLADAHKKADIIQTLVSGGKADSAEKLYHALSQKIKPADILTDFTEKLQDDLRLAMTSPKKEKQSEPVFFKGDEFRKNPKDSTFLLGLVERSTAKTKPETLAKDKGVVAKTKQEKDREISVISPTQNEDVVKEKTPEKTKDVSKTENIQLKQEKLELTDAIKEERTTLENYSKELSESKSAATVLVQQNLEQLEQKINTYHEISDKKLSRSESPEQRENKLRELQDEVIRIAATAKVSSSYVTVATKTEVILQRQIHQLDSLGAIVNQAKAGKEVKTINAMLIGIKAKNVKLVSPGTINQQLRQEVALESKPIIAAASTDKNEAWQKAAESAMLDSLGVVLEKAVKNDEVTGNKKEIASTIKSMKASAVETGIESSVALDSYHTQKAFVDQVAAKADTFNKQQELSLPLTPALKQKELSPETLDARLSDLVEEVLMLSPAAASIKLVQDPREISKRIRAEQTEVTAQANTQSIERKDSLMQKVSVKYEREIAMVEKFVKPPGNEELSKAISKQADTTVLVQSQQDIELKARNETLSKNLSEGVNQLDQLIDENLPVEAEPQIESKLNDYRVIADTALKHLAAEIEAQHKATGSSSDIAMFLELKEYEIRASRNRSLYLTNKLKSAQLSRETGDLALLSSASVMESEADISFTKAWLLRDSAERSMAFLIQRSLYQEAGDLEDSALVRQEKAISIRKDLLAQQQKPTAKQEVKQKQPEKVINVKVEQQKPIAKQDKAAIKQPTIVQKEEKEITKQAAVIAKPETTFSPSDTARISLAANRLIQELPESSRGMAEKLVRAVRGLKLPTINGMYYTVQVGVFATPRNSAQLKGINPLLEDRMKNGYYRYFSGIYGSREAAVQAKNQIIVRGIPDAFVVAVYNGMKLSLAEAKAYEPQSITKQIQESKLEQLVKVVTIPAGKAEFRVQLGAFRKTLSQATLDEFSVKVGGKVMTQLSATGLTLVFCPAYDNFAAAADAKVKIVGAGITDAFIVGFIGGERTTAAKVKELLKTSTP